MSATPRKIAVWLLVPLVCIVTVASVGEYLVRRGGFIRNPDAYPIPGLHSVWVYARSSGGDAIGCSVYVDGRFAGRTKTTDPQLWLYMWGFRRYRVEATYPGYRPWVKCVSSGELSPIEAGGPLALDIDLTRIPPDPQTEPVLPQQHGRK